MKALAVLGLCVALSQAITWDQLNTEWELYKDISRDQLNAKWQLYQDISSDVISASWDQYKVEYGKVYDAQEDDVRLQIFLNNLKEIAQHNMKYQFGEISYKIGVNQFTDMLESEISDLLGCAVNFLPIKGPLYIDNGMEVPDNVDWRKRGIVTYVKDQGRCGSCWAFSTTGSLEGQNALKTGNLTSLSEQNLVDCVTSCLGCRGGWPTSAFSYIQQNGGIDAEKFYPYNAKQGKCRFNKKYTAATVKGYVNIPYGNETALKNAVASVGPISVAIETDKSFQQYSEGIYDNPNCNGQINHAVLVVGYGTQEGKNYWLVKNSWGPKWGEQGYIKMSRNKGNQCFIASYGSYPVV